MHCLKRQIVGQKKLGSVAGDEAENNLESIYERPPKECVFYSIRLIIF